VTDAASVEHAVRAVASFGLPRELTKPIRVDQEAWPELKSRVAAERLTGARSGGSRGKMRAP
jgi:hypothetical protein